LQSRNHVLAASALHCTCLSSGQVSRVSRVDESRAGPRCRSATVTGPMPMPMPAHGPSLSNRQACRNHAGSWLVEPRSVGKVGWENKKTLQCAIYCPFPPSLRPMPLMRERRGELIDTLRYTDTTSGTGHYSSSHRTCLTLPYSEGKCVTLSGEGSTPGDWQVPGPPRAACDGFLPSVPVPP
jgi:hypothetical protein